VPVQDTRGELVPRRDPEERHLLYAYTKKFPYEYTLDREVRQQGKLR
jgi:hypothetical protein